MGGERRWPSSLSSATSWPLTRLAGDPNVSVVWSNVATSSSADWLEPLVHTIASSLSSRLDLASAVLAALFASADAVFARAIHVNLGSLISHVILTLIGTIGLGWLLRLGSLRHARVPEVAPPKLAAIECYAGNRSLAWIDDALSPVCHEWAAARPAPTLLVQTVPEQGLTEREARLLEDWARALPAA